MKILLACSAGMSTSLVESKMKTYMEENGISGTVEAHGSESAKAMLNDFDVVMLGPQVSFMLDDFKSLTSKPVVVMAPSDYAMANAKNIIQQAQKALGKL